MRNTSRSLRNVPRLRDHRHRILARSPATRQGSLTLPGTGKEESAARGNGRFPSRNGRTGARGAGIPMYDVFSAEAHNAWPGARRAAHGCAGLEEGHRPGGTGDTSNSVMRFAGAAGPWLCVWRRQRPEERATVATPWTRALRSAPGDVHGLVPGELSLPFARLSVEKRCQHRARSLAVDGLGVSMCTCIAVRELRDSLVRVCLFDS